MANGTVKWFNDTKGFGFITGQDDNDVFVHNELPAGDGCICYGQAYLANKEKKK